MITNKLKFSLFLSILLIVLTSNFIFSQHGTSVTKYFQFELTDSSKVVGFIVFESSNGVQIKDTSGKEIRINKQNIISQNRVSIKTNNATDSTGTAETIISIAEQTDSTIVRLQLIGGSTLIGRVASEDSTSITIDLPSNSKTTIDKKSIVKREIVTQNLYNGQYWIDDPNMIVFCSNWSWTKIWQRLRFRL